MANQVNKSVQTGDKSANTDVLPSLNSTQSVKVDQEVLKIVPLIVPEESEYTSDVTKKEE